MSVTTTSTQKLYIKFTIHKRHWTCHIFALITHECTLRIKIFVKVRTFWWRYKPSIPQLSMAMLDHTVHVPDRSVHVLRVHHCVRNIWENTFATLPRIVFFKKSRNPLTRFRWDLPFSKCKYTRPCSTVNVTRTDSIAITQWKARCVAPCTLTRVRVRVRVTVEALLFPSAFDVNSTAPQDDPASSTLSESVRPDSWWLSGVMVTLEVRRMNQT